MRVHRSVLWPGPPQERVKSVSPPQGLPIPRVPLGATNPEQRGAAARSSQLAAQRSGSQRRPATAPSPRRKCGDRNSVINEFPRPTSKAAHPATATTSTPTGRPAPAALPVQCYVNRSNNHHQDQSVERDESPPRTSRSSTPPAAMVNWQEAGKTWPRPNPNALRLLRGLVWDQHYRHSHPQCEGGMPGSFELRQDMGPERLQAVEDWLRVEGFAFRFQQRRWRVWTQPDRPGEGLRPDGIEEDDKPNEYLSGASINVSMWDMIEKNFPEPGSERRLQGSRRSASPGKEKRSAGDRKRNRKWREYQASLAAEAAQGARGETPAHIPQRASGRHHPGHNTLGDFLEVAKHTKAKPRPLLLRKSGPSSDVKSAHSGRMPADEATSSGSVAPDQRDVARACERACRVPCNLRVARQRATQQSAAVEGAVGIAQQKAAEWAHGMAIHASAVAAIAAALSPSSAR